MRSYPQTLIRILGILALIVAPLPALAQTPAQQTSSDHEGFGIGAKIGPLFSSLSEVDADGAFEKRTGWTGGLFLGGNRPGIVGVGVDILFARKGANVAGTDVKVQNDYLNVPVYLRINGGSSSLGGAIVYGIVGLDLNFLMKSKITDADGEHVLDVSDDDHFKRADYGLALGIGAEITRFIVEGRYTKGLGNIAKHDDEPELKSSSFAIMFGVRFN